jgi:phosphatidylglycerophosphate synthase
MKYAIKELLRDHIAADDDIFCRLAVYPIALPVTWVVVNHTKLTANSITLTGLGLGVAGGVATLLTQNLGWLGLGFCLFFLCDFVDGQVASVRGGTQFGAMLDLASDFTVLLFATLCLGQTHLMSGQSVELFLLLCFVCLHNYIDLVLFAKHRAATKPAGAELPPSAPRQRGSQFCIWTLFPKRLTSPLAFMGAYFFTGSFVWAYGAALGCVLTEYGTLAGRLGFRLYTHWLHHFPRYRDPADLPPSGDLAPHGHRSRAGEASDRKRPHGFGGSSLAALDLLRPGYLAPHRSIDRIGISEAAK